MLKFAPLINATTVDSEFARLDLVIEVIVENAAAKQELYARIEPQLKPEAILASNTSAISIALLASKLKHPERFVGIHFFNPVRQMPLVEVIRGPQDQRRDGGHGSGLCQGHRQVADCRQRRARVSRQSSVAAVHERGVGVWCLKGSRSSSRSRGQRSSACRWAH